MQKRAANPPAALPNAALLNEHELAARLNLSVRTLQAWRVKGGGPVFLRLGRAIRYRDGDVETWIGANSLAHTSQARAL